MIPKVVILSARAENLVPCVQALLAQEPAWPPGHIIVVDDGARAQAEARLPQVTWVTGVKPFVFARNANLGIRAAGGDVILLNDDARLMTPRGFTSWARQLEVRPEIGLCSAAIRGAVGNPRQMPLGRKEIRIEANALAFVCVYIPKPVYDVIGPLDERFVGYGFEDDDYCARVKFAGLALGIWDGCEVDHSGRLRSTFRMRPDLWQISEHNRRLFQMKQREMPQRHLRGPHPLSAPRQEARMEERSVDLLYLACNRLEFTRQTFDALLANTDWQYINQLFIYDDGSQDGTREWLEQRAREVPARIRFALTRFGSPVTAMVHFIETASAPILAKTDNDAMLPPAWLRLSLDVLARHPELTLLGIEAMFPHDPDVQLPRSYTPADFVSGLGLYRRAAFARSRPVAFNKWFGLEEWQQAQGPGLKRGWINPSIPVFLLDRVPHSPWVDYSHTYIQRGWQRPCYWYDPASTLWNWRWPVTVGAPTDYSK